MAGEKNWFHPESRKNRMTATMSSDGFLTASGFLHFVVNKLRLSNISGIFLCVDKGLDPVVQSQMPAFGTGA